MGDLQSIPSHSPNRLLALLPQDEYQRISPLLHHVPLPVRQILYQARSPIDYVYFPESGVVSAMTVMGDGSAIEVATIGNEGVAGLTAFIGGETSPNEVMVQVAGNSLRMRAETFKKEASQDGHLRRILVRYNTAFSVQVSYSVACNGLHTVEKRCCRWLLMTQDRVGSNQLPLTHEFLSIMLGVRRASITEILQPLQKSGLIHNGRGVIEIVDRDGLKTLACECYEAVNQEFARLFG
jgi:CRP-like cAMP-binding protein